MPELPEVETMVRGIRPVVEGASLAGFRRVRCSCRPILVSPSVGVIARRAAGRTLSRVWRRAKRVILELDSGDAFVIEPRMTGLMLVSDPPDAGHLRVEWQLTRGAEERSLWFWDRRGLGTVRFFRRAELQALVEGGALGRDALEMDAEDWLTALKSTHRPVKVALLDQRLAAGIGNLYASEILHRAGIRPQTPAARLSLARIGRLQLAVQSVLSEAIRYEGSTLSDGTYRNALNQSGGYQNAHRVYDRAGEGCLTCGAPIVRLVQAQRSTFYCPRCQR
ncbi:MAG: bifunctional DNA-formamidopyrimidine glycosylase/DNA-(apurinic or apyrimidinic site) lyase [Planctomyces sp.]|nr:bifunctional DNA-formamidopyrimidine glycosylase/DNA-(apurinic or apyrimidinic site) lyase [Planctomyces sp.]